MNQYLEGLVLALDAVLEARSGQDAERLEAVYQTKLEAVLERNPHLSRERLLQAIDFAHKNWRRVQDKKPSSMPPTA
jgi:hypothetical protein